MWGTSPCRGDGGGGEGTGGELVGRPQEGVSQLVDWVERLGRGTATPLWDQGQIGGRKVDEENTQNIAVEAAEQENNNGIMDKEKKIKYATRLVGEGRSGARGRPA